jgi:hypothetical protein
MGVRPIVWLWPLILCCTLANAAEPAGDPAHARFTVGQQEYESGHFREAAAQFAAAYALAPIAELLFNEAQAWRRDFETTGQRASARRAIELYRRCVASDTLVIADQREAAERLARISEQIMALEAPRPAGEDAALRHRRRGLWIGLGVGGAALAIGLSVGLAVGLTRGATSSADPMLVARW